MRVMLAFTVAVAVLASSASANEPELPRVVLTRIHEHGGSESLTLRCVKDFHGKHEFYCEVLRFRNGIEVATTGIYAPETKAILKSFFKGLPERIGAAVAGDPKSGNPLLVWDVAYRDKAAKGFVPKTEIEKHVKLMDAVLSLEGALAAQFYR